ncbi:MAG: TIR domain-containing protein [Clostridia bacterium]|nr:TIR domain-containing protein [Clostridia bacterium]
MAQNNPYIFISYAHKDDAVVMNILRRMKEYGLNLWYDNGIEAGSEWPTFIANQLKGSACFLALMSKNYIDSKNCRREFNFADMNNIPTLVAFIENFTIEDNGMAMQVALNQCIFMHKFPSENDFAAALCSADMLQCCNIGPEAVRAAEKQTVTTVNNVVKTQRKPEPVPEKIVYVEKFYGEDVFGEYVYSGNMCKGVRHGKGLSTYSDSSLYAGEYFNDRRQGHGRHVVPNGGVYEGEYYNDKRNGHGKFVFADGSVFEGEYVDGNRNGHGIEYERDGSIFEGEYLDGERNGPGRYTRANGKVIVGNWRNGRKTLF